MARGLPPEPFMAGAEVLYRASPIWAQRLLLNAYALRREWYGLGRRGRATLEQISTLERWDRERIQDYQSARLRHVVGVAYRRSRYYRETFDRLGLDPRDIRGVADLHRLPILPRATVRERGPDLLTARRPAGSWTHGHTSGTTGSPLSVWYDRETCVQNNAQDLRQKSWGGMRRGDWIGVFLGRVIVPPRQRRPPFWRANRIQREVWFSSFHMSEETLGAYIAEIRRRRLRFLEGYPSTLFILATYLRRTGQSLPMTAVFTSSETLHPVQREAIEAAFACRLFDFYGLAERTIFAAECEVHEGRHLAEDFGCTEVVDEGGEPVPTGSWGYLVGTSLHNLAMPMIRYRTNDVSRVLSAPCPCGRTFSLLDPVTTKAEDVVVTPDGRLISPSILTHPFKPFDAIVKSQVIQEAPDEVRVKLVAGDTFTPQQQNELVSALRTRLGEGVRIEVTLVADIPPEPSGKFRWVISRVGGGYSPDWDRYAGAPSPVHEP